MSLKSALAEAFAAVHGEEAALAVDSGYVRSPVDNLLPGLDRSILSDLETGDGGELSGPRPKFCALHSSAALAVNSFALMRVAPGAFELAGINGFTQAQFEKRLPTGLRGTPPNLDFFAQGPRGSVAVESKFLEPLSFKKARFASSYARVVEMLAEPAWAAMYKSLRTYPARFRHLDAAQLVKHYLGIRASLQKEEGPTILLYAFWQPSGDSDQREFARHREEVFEFAAAVCGTSVHFEALTHRQIWDTWESSGSVDGASDHLQLLRSRYDVPY